MAELQEILARMVDQNKALVEQNKQQHQALVEQNKQQQEHGRSY